MDLKKLKEPFQASDIEWRISRCGEKQGGGFWASVVPYIQARAIMDRLDEVCGPENWKVSYEFVGTKGVICRLAICIDDADWVQKEDGAEMTDIESFKGGISGALKRAGSAWGIGRYLYDLEEGFAKIVDQKTNGAIYGKTKNDKVFYWLPPELPKWALPSNTPRLPILSAEEKKAAQEIMAREAEEDSLADYLPKQEPAPGREISPEIKKSSPLPNKAIPAKAQISDPKKKYLSFERATKLEDTLKALGIDMAIFHTQMAERYGAHAAVDLTEEQAVELYQLLVRKEVK